VIRVDTQASDAADERPAEVQSQRRSPKGRLGRAIEESGRNEQYWSRQKPWREPQDGALLLRLVPGSDGVERHVQEPYSEVRYTEDHTVLAKGARHGERGYEHRRHRREDHQPRGQRLFGGHGVGQPRIAHSRPPQRRQYRQAAQEA
jgi:hypothetical protein